MAQCIPREDKWAVLHNPNTVKSEQQWNKNFRLPLLVKLYRDSWSPRQASANPQSYLGEDPVSVIYDPLYCKPAKKSNHKRPIYKDPILQSLLATIPYPLKKTIGSGRYTEVSSYMGDRACIKLILLHTHIYKNCIDVVWTIFNLCHQMWTSSVF